MDGISVGAVGAAIIAAIASFVGLILGKEAKTSEFRQQWIDSLRSEIADYLSNVTAIADHLKKTYTDNNEKVADLIPYYHKLNHASCLIRLRLNPSEIKSSLVLEAMDKFEDLSKSDGEFTSEKVESFESEMLKASQSLLKFEWDRVKNGERTFRYTKYGAMIIAILFIGLLFYASARALTSHEGKHARGQLHRARQEEAKASESSKVLSHSNVPPQTNSAEGSKLNAFDVR